MIRGRDIEIINKAIKILDANKMAGLYSMVAVLSSGKKIISVGFNDYTKTHPNTPQLYSYVIPTHAEIDCISKWIVKKRKIKDTMSLYVVGMTRGNEDNFVISSFPCESCMTFIRKVGLSRVVYMTNKENEVNIEEYLL